MIKNKSGKGETIYFPHEIQWTHEKVHHLWNYYSKNEGYQKQYFSYQAGKIVLNHIGRYMKFNKMSALLDYGCGPGFLIEELVKRLRNNQKCFGLDFSKESVALVEKKFAGKPNYGGAVWVEKLPSNYENDSMDLVISLEVIEHLDDEQLSGMTEEIYRILKPHGYISITTPNRENLEENKTMCPECGCIFHRWQHIRMWTAYTLQQYMERSGFKTVHILESNFASKYQKMLKYFFKLFPDKRRSLLYIGVK